MKFKTAVTVLLLTLLLSSIGLADEQAEQVKDLKSEVLLLKQSFNQLCQQLNAQQHQTDELQKLQIAVTYLSFRSRSVELKEFDLRQRREFRDRMEETLAKIEADPDEWDKRNRTSLSNNPGRSSADDTRLSARRTALLRERIESLDTDILKTELEIQEAKEELAEYETYVQKKLNIED